MHYIMQCASLLNGHKIFFDCKINKFKLNGKRIIFMKLTQGRIILL